MDTNLLSPLMTSLEHELGLPTAPVGDSLRQALEQVIMEGAIATFLTTADATTTNKFMTWVEAHATDEVLLGTVFEKFPDLMTAVHAEMVAAIDQAKLSSVAE